MNPFLQFWHLGYRRLVPIVPPDARISENSTMAKRPGARGKAVGVRGNDGAYFGFNWVPYECDERDLERWHNMRCGVGIKTGPQHDGSWLIAIDADTLATEHAATIATYIYEAFGTIPTRIGKAPKALYVVRLLAPLQYARVEFDDGISFDGEGRPLARVELLSEGRQFVAHGIHPDTKRPYEWTVPLVPLSDLPIRDAGALA